MAESLPFSNQNINLINFYKPSSTFRDTLFYSNFQFARRLINNGSIRA